MTKFQTLTTPMIPRTLLNPEEDTWMIVPIFLPYLVLVPLCAQVLTISQVVYCGYVVICCGYVFVYCGYVVVYCGYVFVTCGYFVVIIVAERSQRERLRDLAVFERLHGNPRKTSADLAVKKVHSIYFCI